MKAAVLHGARDIRIEPYRQPELHPGMVLLRSRRVGICGTDLHYYEHGYNATFVPDRPFILGHELTGEVVAVAADVQGLTPGQRVAVNPARSCGFCDYCKGGQINLCRKTIMLGSASTTPPTDGALAEFLTVRADQCHLLPEDMDDGAGAMMEPLSVALHAVKRAGTISGKRVLVTGAAGRLGPGRWPGAWWRPWSTWCAAPTTPSDGRTGSADRADRARPLTRARRLTRSPSRRPRPART